MRTYLLLAVVGMMGVAQAMDGETTSKEAAQTGGGSNLTVEVPMPQSSLVVNAVDTSKEQKSTEGENKKGSDQPEGSQDALTSSPTLASVGTDDAGGKEAAKGGKAVAAKKGCGNGCTLL